MDDRYEKNKKTEKKVEKYSTPWRLLSDDEKADIKRKSMERKAEEMMKESKKKDEINAGRQRTQFNSWE